MEPGHIYSRLFCIRLDLSNLLRLRLKQEDRGSVSSLKISQRAKSEEMFPTSVDKVLREIASLKDRNPLLTSQMKDRIQTLQMELGFLKMFIWCSPNKSLRKSYIRAAARIGKGKLGLYGTSDRALDRAVSKLLQEVQLCKQKIREDCLHLFDFSSQCKFSSSYELPQFIDCTISNLRNLVRLKAGAIMSVRMQVKALIKKLRTFRDFVKSTEEWLFLSIDIQDWAYKVACLSTLYWVDQVEEAMAARMNAVLSDLLQMVKSCSPEVVGLYLLKASELASFDRFQIGEVIESFVDFILPIGFMKVLRGELSFLIAFLMDPPEWEPDAEEGNLSSTKAKAIASEIPSLICSLTVGATNESTVKERNDLLGDFREKTDEVKAEVRKFYIQNPDSSRPRFPITNALGFMDLLLENFGNLKETLISKAKHIPFAKYQLVTLYKDLVSLEAFLKKAQELQNDLEKLKDLQMRITDVAYQVEYVIDSCQMADFPIWYNVIRLSDVIEEVKFIKRGIREIMHKQRVHNIGVLNPKVDSGNIYFDQADNSSRPDEVVVGFKDEAEKIIVRLTRGSKKLDIVSIVGMPGQGKTTLAKKVYNSPSVRYHFNKCAWCFVTQVYEDKMLLLDILRDVTTMLDDKIHNISKEDLAHKLYKCLRGQRYLIIMDDIWDITAWNALKEAFPDDNNGSRILFTSRNEFVCNPHWLRPLNEEESIELVKQKLFSKDGWPSNFSNDVKQILKVCNGLPLAVVVVAGLLKGASNNLDQWRQIVRKLDSKLASEGCMDILELSYKNLPDLLKPCFLYLGAVVRQSKVFKVHKLIQLWIAEGFVQKSGIKSLEDVAIEYLEDLAGRNLVIFNKRGFTGGKVKECRIHDLLHELCLKKAEEERFMHFSSVPPYSSKPTICEQYRLCIYSGWMAYSWGERTSPIVRSLLFPLGNQFPNNLISGFFLRFKFVRVLDLWNVGFDNCFPVEILSLICLRYLAIWSSVEVIPPSIGNLCNLESFHVKSWKNILQFPHTIWKMKALRNVDIVGTAEATILLDDYDANVCPKLDNLDSFSSLYLCNVEDAEKILRGFPGVRKLKLEFSKSWDCRRDCDQFQVLYFLRKLESLNLQYSGKVAHTCAFNFPTTLKKLTLSKFNRPWSKISAIGKLPNLEVLKLLNSGIVGERWDVGDEEFLNLKYLKLSILKISHWEASTSSFPCLERLVVRHCRFLVELPSVLGDVITLKMMEVRRCPEGLSTSAKSILDEHRDMGNRDLEVLISDVFDEDRLFSSSVLASPRVSTYSIFGWDYVPGFQLCESMAFEFNKKVARVTLDVREPCQLDKKGVIERTVACVTKRHVPSARRTNLVLKHNCQPRQAIMSRYSKKELKRD